MDLFRKRLQSVFTLCSCSCVKETSRDEIEEMAGFSRDIREELGGLLQVLKVFDSAIEEVSSLESRHVISQDEIQSCKLDLRFLRMFFWSIFTLDDTHHDDAEIRHMLVPVKHSLEAINGISRNKIGSPSGLEDTKLEAETWFLDVQGRIQHCKQECELSCILLLRCLLRCNSYENKMPLDFRSLDGILENLKDLCKFKNKDGIRLTQNEIPTTTLHKMLRLLHILFDPTPEEWSGFEEMRKFKVAVHAFAQYLAILVFCYWVKTGRAAHLRTLLINVLEKYRPCVPVFKAFYIRFLKEMKLRQLDSPLMGEIIQIFLDLLFDSLDVFDMVHFISFQNSLMFVIAFLRHPLRQHAKDKEMMTIIVEIEVLVNEYLDLFLLLDKRKGDFYQASSDFKRKVELLKGKIQQVDKPIRDTFSYDFPKINGLGYFNFLIRNIGFLKEKMNRDVNFITFPKDVILKIEVQLLYLRPYLNDLFEQQKEHKELKDTWLKVINLAYQIEYAINSCLVLGNSLWYNMARLMEVLDEITAVYSKLKNIEGRKTQDGGGLHCSAVALNKVPKDPWASGSNAVMVGLKNEVNIIVENLINGSKILTIVAIVGMAGIGKTTIANEVYNAPAVRQYFHMFAYCIVSQVHNAKMILLDILCDIKEKDDEMFDMEEEDLAEMLRKCLKGQRYLIIMDDIWDVKAWDEVKRSLPDDQNGSRIIFTSRIRNVALQAKNDCIIYDLRFLSDEESLELLRKKAFRAECCPPDFLEVGKVIARNCKGLPLAIVLIAGLIAKTERNLNWWNKISKTIESYGFREDCTDLLELSYQHLPEHLKPCFLYFGAFAEDTSIPVNKLTLLWIVEGFVQNSNNENLEKVAKEYLCDLIDRSLVIANERSSYGGIKSCRIHDLLHEFCQGKAQEENFFQFMDGYEASSSSSSSSSTVRNPYRVCIHMKGKYLGDATKICPNIHSLLGSRKSGYNPYDISDVSYLKLVQVINLEELEWDNLIRKIASLVHLRFLAISFVSEHLSSEITLKLSDLWNLEILILTGRRSFKLVLPETIWNMTRLRHVDVGGCYLSSLSVHKGKAYPQMIFLESFSSPSISSTEVLEDLLLRSPSLRKLCFDYDSLGEGCGKRGFHFPKLSKLESLNVSSVGEPFLRSLDFLSTLKKLTLSNCFIHWRYLPAVSKMPCLEVLKLLDYAFIGHVWDMEDTEFPKLKFLKLHNLNVGEWIANPESFPSLEVLIVNKCDKLNAIPPCFGEMPTLKRIEVFESDGAATSVVQIQDVQKEFGNEELEVLVSAPSKKENLLLHISDDDSCDQDDELEEEIEVASLCA